MKPKKMPLQAFEWLNSCCCLAPDPDDQHHDRRRWCSWLSGGDHHNTSWPHVYHWRPQLSGHCFRHRATFRWWLCVPLQWRATASGGCGTKRGGGRMWCYIWCPDVAAGCKGAPGCSGGLAGGWGCDTWSAGGCDCVMELYCGVHCCSRVQWGELLAESCANFSHHLQVGLSVFCFDSGHSSNKSW